MTPPSSPRERYRGSCLKSAGWAAVVTSGQSQKERGRNIMDSVNKLLLQAFMAFMVTLVE